MAMKVYIIAYDANTSGFIEEKKFFSVIFAISSFRKLDSSI